VKIFETYKNDNTESVEINKNTISDSNQINIKKRVKKRVKIRH
jgi:hypothetical protein